MVTPSKWPAIKSERFTVPWHEAISDTRLSWYQTSRYNTLCEGYSNTNVWKEGINQYVSFEYIYILYISEYKILAAPNTDGIKASTRAAYSPAFISNYFYIKQEKQPSFQQSDKILSENHSFGWGWVSGFLLLPYRRFKLHYLPITSHPISDQLWPQPGSSIQHPRIDRIYFRWGGVGAANDHILS